MYALIEMRMQLFRRKITKIFSDIDALAVSMSEKLLRVCRRHTRISLEKRVLLFSENVTKKGAHYGFRAFASA